MELNPLFVEVSGTLALFISLFSMLFSSLFQHACELIYCFVNSICRGFQDFGGGPAPLAQSALTAASQHTTFHITLLATHTVFYLLRSERSSAFLPILLILSGDIKTNPGPTYTYPTCNNLIINRQHSLQWNKPMDDLCSHCTIKCAEFKHNSGRPLRGLHWMWPIHKTRTNTQQHTFASFEQILS